MTHINSAQSSDPPVAELEFLARSPHRIQILSLLSGEEQTRRELHDLTDISQPTLGRILGDFEQRRWVSNHHDGTYTLTPLGEMLAGSVGDLLEVLGTVTQLADIVDHLPWDRFTFDLSHLSEARITTPSTAEPLVHMRRFDELAADAAVVKVFSNVLSCSPTSNPAATEDDFLAHADELIVTSDALPSRQDEQELPEQLLELIRAEELSVYAYDEPAVFLFGIFDETVGIVPIDDGGMPCGLIETTTEPIGSWVRETFESYRRSASRVTPDRILY